MVVFPRPSVADLRTVGRDFFVTLRVTDALVPLTQAEFRGLAISLVELAHDGPRQLQRLLAELDEGTLPLTATGSDAAGDARRRRARIAPISSAVVAVGLAAVLTGSSLPGLGGVSLV